MTQLWAVILAGGVGSRFWPLSTPELPKQLLPLVETRSLLSATVERFSPLVPRERTLLLTNEAIVSASLEVLHDFPPANVLAEPRPAGTAAALAWAALEIERRGGPEAVMICVHADWYIGDEAGFREVLTQAAEAAVRFNALVTVGIVPSRADPGFGYIQPGDATTPSSSARKVQQFVEKPDREGAARMCAEGYLWNSGIFVWTVACFLEQLRQHTPEVAPALGDGLSSAEFFSRVQSVSVDVGVLERSGSVLVVPGEFGWDDIGTWSALKRVLPTDSAGNATRGVAHAVDSHRNVVYSPDSVVVLYGVDDLVVVCESDVTLVTTMDRSADLKQLLQRLPPEVSSR